MAVASIILLMHFGSLKANLRLYVQNKTWYWYVPAWLFGLYMFVKILDFELGSESAFVVAVPQAFDFFLHETAHLVFGFLPAIFVAGAGSASELLLGAGLIITAFITRSYFASLFCGLWYMLAAQSVADYIADARAQALPLISFGGGDPIHDWHFILGELGLLSADTAIAAVVRTGGILVGVASLAFGLWLIYRMATYHPAISEDARPKAKDITMEIGVPHIPEAAAKSPGLYPEALHGTLGMHEDPQPAAKHQARKM